MPEEFVSAVGFAQTGERKSIRRYPALVWTALRLVWAASPASFVTTSCLQLAAGAGVAAQLLLFNRVLQEVLAAERTMDSLAGLLPLLIALIGIMAGLSFAAAVASGQRRLLAERAIRHVNELILDVAGSVDLEAFDRPEFFDRLQRARQNAIAMPLQVATTFVDLLGTAFAVVGIAGVLVSLHPLLLPLVMLGYAPLYAVTVRNTAAMYSFSFGQAPYDRARFYLSQVLTGKDEAKEVRAFSLQRFLGERWGRLYDERIAEIAHLVRRHVRRSLIASLGTSVLTAGALAVLMLLFLTRRINVAEAATAGLAMGQLGSRLMGLAVSGAGALYEGALFLDDFNAFVGLQPSRADTRDAPAAEPFSVLTAQDVRFAYPPGEPDVLKGVSLEIRAGEIVALVGENGSGKTTLAKLLCQLYRPTSGRILWDGVDTASCEPVTLRRRIAVIFQDFIRYRLAAWENIAIGDPARAEQRDAIVAASRQAGADGYLASLPSGYDTVLSKEFERGTDLSIGQWQRVALARAFFRDAPFIILDEPTAALDPRAEYELFQGIRTLCRGRAVLVISHRFSSVRSADRIYVLADGEVVEHGPHDELMRNDGLYAELFTLQSSMYLGDVPPEASRSDAGVTEVDR